MGFKAGKTDMADSLHKNKRGILGRLQDYDEYVTHKLYQLGLCVPRFVWKALEYSGDGFVWLALASLLLVGHAVVLEKEQEALSRTWYGLVLHRIGMVDELLGPNLMLGLLVDLVEVGLLKGMFKRPRPGHNALAGDMKIVVAVDAHSFPSGHSSRVSFIALLVRLSFPPCFYVLKNVCLIWAAVVALSRCMMGRHHFSDVLSGLLLGIVTVNIVTRVDWI